MFVPIDFEVNQLASGHFAQRRAADDVHGLDHHVRVEVVVGLHLGEHPERRLRLNLDLDLWTLNVRQVLPADEVSLLGLFLLHDLHLHVLERLLAILRQMIAEYVLLDRLEVCVGCVSVEKQMLLVHSVKWNKHLNKTLRMYDSGVHSLVTDFS